MKLLTAPSDVSVTVLYNTDYDGVLGADTPDARAVHDSATELTAALCSVGLAATVMPVAAADFFRATHDLVGKKRHVVFNLCESLAGSPVHEALVPATLDMLHIPYTGNASLALATCLDKHFAKTVLRGAGVPTPHWRLLDDPAQVDTLVAADFAQAAFPWFLKLARQDASLGISSENRVRDLAALRVRASAMWREYGEPVLAEPFIEGREINVTLLADETGAPAVLPLHEIDFSAMPADRPRIISYAGKWDESHPEYGGSMPIAMSPADPLTARVTEVAVAAWRALGLRDYARVDVRVDPQLGPLVIDVNPNCDLTVSAGYARAVRAGGHGYGELLGHLVALALRRSQ